MEQLFDLDQFEPSPNISAEYVLDQVDDVLIYRHYLGNFQLGTKFQHPYRKDIRPSFAIFFASNALKLMFKDFGTGESGDCFKLVSKMFGITYSAAIEKVAVDFGITKGVTTVTKKQIQEARNFKEEFQKREFLIQVSRRAMNTEELDYWKQYFITREDLLANNIFGIDKMWMNKKQVPLDTGLHFAYYFPEQDKWKIYSPYSTDWKWFGNISTSQMEGIDQLTLRDNSPVIITKSRKDRIILKKLYHNVCSSQNESEHTISKDMDTFFDTNFPSKYCWFDSDEPGKNANRKLNHRGYKWINVPNELYTEDGLKDPSDVIKHFGWDIGKEILIKEMIKKGIHAIL